MSGSTDGSNAGTATLQALKIHTTGELAKADPAWMLEHLGKKFCAGLGPPQINQISRDIPIR